MCDSKKYSVQITGPALAFLYYTASSSSCGGFLLGSVVEQEIDYISDANEDGSKVEILIRITGVLPCYDSKIPCSLFDNSGTINREISTAIFSKQRDSSQKVVGWFSCCRGSRQHKPSFRESALHWQFLEKFSAENPRNFILVNVQNVLNLGSMTHEFQSKFYHLGNAMKRKWSLLSGSVLNCNLKTAGTSNKTAYRSLPTLEPRLLSEFAHYHENLGRVGHQVVSGVIESTYTHMDEAVQRITKINAAINRTLEEIETMKENTVKLADDSGDDNDDFLSQESFVNNTLSPPITRRAPKKQTKQESGSTETTNKQPSSPSKSSQEY